MEEFPAFLTDLAMHEKYADFYTSPEAKKIYSSKTKPSTLFGLFTI